MHSLKLLTVLFALAFVAACPVVGRAQVNAVEAVVAKADPSIACVIVSRSDWYRKNGYGKLDAEAVGQLGSFNANFITEIHAGARATDSLRERSEKLESFRLKYNLADSRHIPETFGSGIVVDADGLILTNYHVVQDATKVFVRLPGGEGSYANIWAADPRSDLAVLKLIDERLGQLKPMTFGNADAARRGQQVVVLANPFVAGQRDGQPSVSVGVISNIQRRVPGRKMTTESNAAPLYQFGILFQTDARIALGSSGGALLNMQGECIGITTSLAAIAGADAPGGFALPVTGAIRKVIDTLKRGEQIDYGFLGVSLQGVPGHVPGAMVSDRGLKGGPAQTEAQLNGGDIIVAIGTHAVRDDQDLMLALGLFFAGDKIPLTVLRGGFGKEQIVHATLVKYHVQGKTIASSLGKRPYVDGLRVDYTSLLVQKPNSGQELESGVLVTDVKATSKAATKQIFVGDIITHVAGARVSTPAAFYDRIGRIPGPVELTINRGGQTERIRW